MSPPSLGVVGLGKLGACLLAVLKASGFDAVGADIDPEAVAAIGDGKPPPAVHEPGLAELLADHRPIVTTDVAAVGEASDVVFIVVPTPSGADDRFDPSLVCGAVDDLCAGFVRAGRDTDRVPPVVVVVSTVMPGTCGGPISDCFVAHGLTVGESVGLVYSPEFVALGSVVHDLLSPDVVYVGADDEWTGNVVASIYARLTPAAEQVRLSLVDAEVAKLAVNVFLSVKVGYANTIARVCETIEGADAGNVLAAVGSDSRIGLGYLRAGGPPGGPCLGRDLLAFETLAWRVTSRGSLADAAGGSADDMSEWVRSKVVVATAGRDRPVVAVLGLSYKPGTPVVEGSFGFGLAAGLAFDGWHVVVHDPLVGAVPAGCHSLPLPELLDMADVVVVATAHDDYVGLAARRGQTLVDVWGVCSLSGPGRVVRPGVGPT